MPTGDQYRKSFRRYIDQLSLIDTVRAIEFDHSIPQVRALSELWRTFRVISLRNAKKIAVGITPEQVKENIQIATEAFSFSARQDLLDMEILHYAVMGKTKKKKTEPVICVTADPFLKTKIRIEMMKAFIEHAFESFVDAGRPMDEFMPSPGKVLFPDVCSDNNIIHVNMLQSFFKRMQSEVIEEF